MSTCTIGDPTCPDPAQCPEGSLFVQNTLKGTCEICSPSAVLQEGYYCNEGVQTICPTGYYCPYEASSVPIICPDGYFCREGFSEGLSCNHLSKCPEGSGAKSPGVGAVLLIILVAVATSVLVWFVRSMARRRKAKSLVAANRHKGVGHAYADLVQAVSGEPIATPPMQGFNEKIRYLNPVSIQFQDLGMTLKSNGQMVLEGVTGEFPPGSLVACMGGSGAGKSTFMNALANRAPYGKIIGSVSINHMEGETLAKYPRLVGFVPQDDIMHDDLTVYENLLYSAKLRLPSSMDLAQQQAIVEDVLEILDLTRIRDVVVGGTTKRGISGGQKKRVNIGMELVAYPRVLFLDEPTSGLDSAASLQVARCLQRMRALGITVVTVIHQPRYSVFRCFSHCILFAKGGRLVYLGPTVGIRGYFENLGFSLPAGENVADWFIDIVSGQSVCRLENGEIDKEFVPEKRLPEIWKSFRASGGDQLLSRRSSSGVSDALGENTQLSVDHITKSIQDLLGGVTPDEPLKEVDLARMFTLADIANEPPADIVSNLYAQLKDSLPSGAVLTPRTFAEIIVKNNAVDGGKKNENVSKDQQISSSIENREPSSFQSQLVSFIYRCLAKFDVKILLIRCLIAAVGAVIVGLTFKGDLDYSQLPTIGQSGLILFCIISAASFLYVFGDERIVFTRESQSGFSIPAYWLAKNLVNIIDLFLITLFYYTFFFAIILPDYRFGEGLGQFLLMAWFTSSLSHFFSVALEPASALLIAVLLPSLYTSMFGGVKPAYDDMTNAQKVIAFTGSGFYAIQDLTVLELNALPGYTIDTAPVQSLINTYSLDLECLTKNSLIMLAIGCVWRIFTLMALYTKVHGFQGMACIMCHCKRSCCDKKNCCGKTKCCDKNCCDKTKCCSKTAKPEPAVVSSTIVANAVSSPQVV